MTQTTDLRAALLAAISQRDHAADYTTDPGECADCRVDTAATTPQDSTVCPRIIWTDGTALALCEECWLARADAEISAARAALAASDEPREYLLRCDGADETLVARPSEIDDLAEEWLRDGGWSVEDGNTSTIWVDGYYRDQDCDPEGRMERVTVQIDPEAPACRTRDDDGCLVTHEDHDWRDGQPRGHGGGVIYRDTCRRCGLIRVTDTWAQRPDTGEQGLESVSYEATE